MTVGVIAIRRDGGDSNDQQRDQGGDQVEQGMGRLGQKAQTTGQPADQKLKRSQAAAGHHRSGGDRFFGIGAWIVSHLAI